MQAVRARCGVSAGARRVTGLQPLLRLWLHVPESSGIQEARLRLTVHGVSGAALHSMLLADLTEMLSLYSKHSLPLLSKHNENVNDQAPRQLKHCEARRIEEDGSAAAYAVTDKTADLASRAASRVV